MNLYVNVIIKYTKFLIWQKNDANFYFLLLHSTDLCKYKRGKLSLLLHVNENRIEIVTIRYNNLLLFIFIFTLNAYVEIYNKQLDI